MNKDIKEGEKSRQATGYYSLTKQFYFLTWEGLY